MKKVKVYFDGKPACVGTVIRKLHKEGCDPEAIAAFLVSATFAGEPIEGPNKSHQNYRIGTPGHYRYADRPPGDRPTTRLRMTAKTMKMPPEYAPDRKVQQAVNSNWMPADNRGLVTKITDYIHKPTTRLAEKIGLDIFYDSMPGRVARHHERLSSPRGSGVWHAVGRHMVLVDPVTDRIASVEAHALEPDWWDESGGGRVGRDTDLLLHRLVGTKMSDLFAQAKAAGQPVRYFGGLNGAHPLENANSSDAFLSAKQTLAEGGGHEKPSWATGVYTPARSREWATKYNLDEIEAMEDVPHRPQ